MFHRFWRVYAMTVGWYTTWHDWLNLVNKCKVHTVLLGLRMFDDLTYCIECPRRQGTCLVPLQAIYYVVKSPIQNDQKIKWAYRFAVGNSHRPLSPPRHYSAAAACGVTHRRNFHFSGPLMRVYLKWIAHTNKCKSSVDQLTRIASRSTSHWKK